MVPPHAGDLVEQRLVGVRVDDDVLDREVGGDVGPGEREEGDREQGEVGQRGRLGNPHETAVTGLGAPRGQGHLHQCDDQREDDGEMSEFDDHAHWPHKRRADSLSPLAGRGLG